MAKQQASPKDKSYEELGKMLTNIYESGYINRNEAYKMSFLKGVVAGLGGVLGATIVVATLLWILSLFNQVPLIGPALDALQDSVETRQDNR